MASQEQMILTVSQKGFGKRTSAYAYRKTARGGQGVATLDVSQRTGGVVDAFPVSDNNHILLLTDQGQLMRFPVTQVRMASRKTQGVILLRVAGEEKIVSVVRLQEEDVTGEEADLEDGADALGTLESTPEV
jgi:DNA gyrase subunit A